MNKKEELEILIESQESMEKKGLLSDYGKAQLGGLKQAYDIIFPLQIEESPSLPNKTKNALRGKRE